MEKFRVIIDNFFIYFFRQETPPGSKICKNRISEIIKIDRMKRTRTNVWFQEEVLFSCDFRNKLVIGRSGVFSI